MNSTRKYLIELFNTGQLDNGMAVLFPYNMAVIYRFDTEIIIH